MVKFCETRFVQSELKVYINFEKNYNTYCRAWGRPEPEDTDEDEELQEEEEEDEQHQQESHHEQHHHQQQQQQHQLL